MVYNNMTYRPASLTEKLQARFGSRVRTAVFRAVSSEYRAEPVKEQNAAPEMISFFGRLDDARPAGRAIPTKESLTRDAMERRARTDVARAARPVTRTFEGARPAEDNARRNTAPAKAYGQVNVRPGADAHMNKKAKSDARRVPAPTPEIAKTFSKAYNKGAKIKRVAESGAVPRRKYPSGDIPPSVLKRGRSNVPGSRHAILVTENSGEERGSIISRIKAYFTDRHVAEHRVDKSPFPLGFVSLVCICAFAVMMMLFTFSQIHEYNSDINELKATHSEIEKRAAKLEVLIEERDDIRNIEKIAVEEMGMVSVDMAESKFVSVSAPDRVEVVEVEEPREETGVSQLLSIIGERLDGIGEYFN